PSLFPYTTLFRSDSGLLRLKAQTRHGLFLGAHAQVTNGGGLVTGDVAASGLPRGSHNPILNQTVQWYKQRGRPHSRETARAPWCWLSRTATGTSPRSWSRTRSGPQ